MSLKITFVNPNNHETTEKYLPKILAEAIVNQVIREMAEADERQIGFNAKKSASRVRV